MTGRQHHAQIGTHGAHQVGDTGSGDHTEADDINPSSSETRDHGGFEKLAAGAGIASDKGERSTLCTEGSGLAQHVGGRNRQFEREFGSQIQVRGAANPIGPE